MKHTRTIKITLIVLACLVCFILILDTAVEAENGSMQTVPMDKIRAWEDMYSLFDAGVESAQDNSSNLLHQISKAIYQYADLSSIYPDLALSPSDQELQDELMVNLVRENFVSYYISREKGLEKTAEQFLDQIGDLNESAGEAMDVIMLEFPHGGEVYSISSFLPNQTMFSDTAVSLYQLAVGTVRLYCRTKNEMRNIFLMQMTHDCAMDYLDHLQQVAKDNTSLFRACETIRRQVNERWPFGRDIPEDLISRDSKELARQMLSMGYDGLLSAAYQDGGILITGSEVIQPLQKFSYALIAMKAGAFIGHLLTPYTGSALEEEDELLRLYLAADEIRQALWSAPDELSFDIASLYLTAEEAGLRKACSFFVDTGYSIGTILLHPDYSSEETFESIAEKQLARLNEIREEMGIYTETEPGANRLANLSVSNPEELYGVWEFDWNQKFVFSRKDGDLLKFFSELFSERVIMTIGEDRIQLGVYLNSGESYRKEEIKAIKVDQGYLTDESGGQTRWRLTDGGNTLYLFADEAEADERAIRFFRIGGHRKSAREEDSGKEIPYDLRGSWVVIEAAMADPSGWEENLLRENGQSVNATLSFTDTTMTFTTGIYLPSIKTEEMLTLKDGVLESEKGRLLTWQFNEDQSAVALRDSEGQRIMAYRFGTKGRFNKPQYPQAPVFHSTALEGEWILIDYNGDKEYNRVMADQFRKGWAYTECLEIDSRYVTVRTRLPDSYGNDGTENQTQKAYTLTAQYMDVENLRSEYELKGDLLTIWGPRREYYSALVRKGSQKEEKLRAALIQQAIDGYYVFKSRLNPTAVTSYHGDSDHLDIPEMSDEGIPVIGVESHALDEAKHALSVTLPGAIEFFEYQHLPSLREFIVDEDNPRFMSLDGVLFSKDGTKLIYYPAGSERTEYEIPSGVTTIGRDAFRDTIHLKKIIAPAGLSVVQENAFSGCTGLETVILPESLSEISVESFSGCPSLTGIHLPQAGAGTYRSMDGVLYSGDGTQLILYPTGSERVEFIIPDGVSTILKGAFRNAVHLKNVTAPSGFSRISEDAFSGCTALETVILPENVQEIGARAFNGCVSLTDLWLPLTDGTRWNASAFEGCASLRAIHTAQGTAAEKALTAAGLPVTLDQSYYRTVEDPDGNIRIISGDVRPFVDPREEPWSSLIPDGKAAVMEGNINNKPWLLEIYADHTELTLSGVHYGYDIQAAGLPWEAYGSSITVVWYRISNDFKWTLSEDGLLKVVGSGDMPYVSIPWPSSKVLKVELDARLTSVSVRAFSGCTALTEFSLPKGISLIGISAFEGCTGLKRIILPDTIRTIGGDAFRNCTSLEDVSLAEGLTEIYSSAFEGCASLKQIIIPDSVTMISYNTFYRCTQLASVTLGKNLKTIESSMFRGCQSLKKIEIPSSVESIGDAAFMGCSSLIELSISDSVKEIAKDAFADCIILKNIDCPAGSYAEEWAVKHGYLTDRSGDTSQLPSELLTSGTYENISWSISADYELRISGAGNMPADCDKNTPWKAFPIRKVVLENGINEISPRAFAEFTELTDVELSDELWTIGEAAFEGCVKLSGLTLPARVMQIGARAFSRTALTGIELPSRLLRPEAYIFSGCEKLETIVLHDGIEEIGDGAFENCVSLQSVRIESARVEIRKNAFSGCKALKEISLPGYVILRGNEVFRGCASLTLKDFPYFGDDIPAGTFNGCESLTNIVVHQSTYRIGGRAFSNCVRLESVVLPSTLRKIDDTAFENCRRLSKVICVQGSYADQWAQKHRISTEYMVEPQETPTPTATLQPTPAPTVFSAPTANGYVSDESDFTVTTAARNGKRAIGGKHPCIAEYRGSDRVVSIPNEIDGKKITVIGPGAFENNQTLEKVIIPEGIVEIQSAAFRGCTALREIVFPSTLSDICASAFAGCTALRTVNIPAGVYLHSFVFAGCTALETIQLQGPLNRSDAHSYYFNHGNFIDGCTSLREIITPEDFLFSREGMWIYHYYNTKKLLGYAGREAGETFTVSDSFYSIVEDGIGSTVKKLIVPDSSKARIGSFEGENVETIELGANALLEGLGAMPHLKEILVSPGNGYGLYVQDGVLFEDRHLVKYPARLDSAQTVYTVPEDIYYIDQNAFAYSTLKEIILPSTLVTLNAAFRQSALERITIPASVRSINYLCFSPENTPHLISVRVERDSFAEQYCIQQGLPYEYYEADRADEDESALQWASRQEDFRFIISKSGNGFYAELTAYVGNDAWVRIPDRVDGYPVTHLVNYLFMDNHKLRKVIIPEGVSRAGQMLFQNCTSLTEVSLPDTLKTLPYGMFQGCSSLKSISLPADVILPRALFKGCRALERIEFRGGIRTGGGNFLEGYDGQPNFVSLSGEIFFDHPYLFAKNKDGTCLICGRVGEEEERIEIPEFVSEITDDLIGKNVRALIIPDQAPFILHYTYRSTGLETIRIGANTSLDLNRILGECPALKTIEVSPDNKELFVQNGVLFFKSAGKKHEVHLIKYPAGLPSEDGIYRVPEGTERISTNAFAHAALNEIILPSTVKRIDGNAFSGSKLGSLTIPSSVTSINAYLGFAELGGILVEKGSYAEQYCVEHGLSYSYLESSVPCPTLIPDEARAAMRSWQPAATAAPRITASRSPDLTPTATAFAAEAVSPAAQRIASATPTPDSVASAGLHTAEPTPVSTPSADHKPKEELAQPAEVAHCQPVPGYSGIMQALIDQIEAPYLVGKKHPTAYTPDKMSDGLEETSWQFSLKDNQLKNTYVNFRFIGPVDLTALWIKNGSWKAGGYTANCRIRKMDIRFRSGNSEWSALVSVELKDDTRQKDWQRIDLGIQRGVTEVQFCINSIYKGKKYTNDVCVAELMFICQPEAETVSGF